MENARRWQPPVEDRTHIPPRGAILLASAAKRPNPEFAHKMLEAAHGGDVGGHGVVVVPPDDHPLQPTSLFRDGRAPMPPEFLLDRTQLGAHPVAPRFSPKQKAAASGAPADMRESEEVECLRFARAAPLSVRKLQTLAPIPLKSLCRIVLVRPRQGESDAGGRRGRSEEARPSVSARAPPPSSRR